MICLRGVSLCFSNVTENVSKRIGYNPSKLWNGSHSLHGEGFPSAGLSVSEYGSCKQIKDKVLLSVCKFLQEMSNSHKSRLTQRQIV